MIFLRPGATGLFFLLSIFFWLWADVSLGESGVRQFKGASFTFYKLDVEQTELKLVSRQADGSRVKNPRILKSVAAKEGKVLEFATNAGIFGWDFIPLGLHIEEGREIVPINRRSGSGNFYLKPNGVFWVKGSEAGIVETSQYDSELQPRLAVQSGPLLLLDGKIPEQFNPASANRLIRNAVGVRGSSEVYFVLSSTPVSFYDLALFFKDELKCNRALYLDGIISTMYHKGTEARRGSADFAALFVVFEQKQ